MVTDRRVWIVLAIALAIPATALAVDPGLFVEKSTATDGVTIRRIRDTEEGVVCYIVVGKTQSDIGPTAHSFRGSSPAISCVKVK